MNRAPPNGLPPDVVTALHLPDFDVSWAGPSPLGQGYCFGSEDGRIVYTDESGRRLSEPARVSPSAEAINGVARSGDWMAASTRAEVSMARLLLEKDQQDSGVVVFPHGAHGITAAPGGYFVAPLGRAGVMILRAGSTIDDEVGGLTSDEPGMYFYRVIALPGRNGKDLLVSACREGGIGITELQWGQPTYNMGLATFAGLDVVDVCALPSNPESPALAALGRDGTLILLRNAFRGEERVTMKFHTVQGTAYRLLCSGPHLFVLTSSGLYGLMKLADRLVNGTGSFSTQILSVRMEPVDANTVGDRWLLVVTPDEILRFDLSALERMFSKGINGAEMSESIPETLTPQWEMYRVPQTSRKLVGTP